ncbi:MAG: hypothetical protein AB7G75_34225, partial [Candidatus Binatia bacterium]
HLVNAGRYDTLNRSALLNAEQGPVKGERGGGAAMIDVEHILQFIQTMIEQEVASGYARVRQIPSTTTWRTIDYLNSLSPTRRRTLLTAFATRGVRLLRPDLDPQSYTSPTSQEALLRFADECLRIPDFEGKYLGARLLRGIFAAVRTEPSSEPLAHVSAAVLQRATMVQPTKSTAVRKIVKQMFTERFKVRAENFGGGNWNYFGEYDGQPFKVMIDYGGRSEQLRYWLFYEHKNTGIRAHMLTYEGLLGLGFGHWDFVTADNLQQSISLLCDLLTDLLALPQKFTTHSSLTV